tara:strand:- start:9118 stop:9522 length:405 start_codon:yes stop_codon:yes gene_type:complete
MKMRDIKKEEEMHSEKSFGLLMSAIISIAGIYLYFTHNQLIIEIFVIAIALILISFFAPKFLSIPSYLWYKLGRLLHLITSPIIILIIFTFIIVPTGLCFKLFSYNPLNKKITDKYASYWVDRTNKSTSFDNQF